MSETSSFGERMTTRSHRNSTKPDLKELINRGSPFEFHGQNMLSPKQ